MSRNFFIFFVFCEALFVVIYVVVIILRNSKYHFLSTIELQGPLIISTLNKSDPFNICAWSISANKYIEYKVGVDADKQITYTETDNEIEETLSRDRYFDVRVGDFVNANYNQPFYNKKFNYCYGRTYIKNGEKDTVSATNDDSNINIDRVFVSFIRKNGENIYDMDLANQKLTNVIKPAFPDKPVDGQTVEWNIIRYYEYLNEGNKNGIIPNENNTDISAQNKSIYFKYYEESHAWKLEPCRAGMLFNGSACIPDITLITTDELTSRSGEISPQIFIKTVDMYSEMEDNDDEDIQHHNYKHFKILNMDIHLKHENDKLEYMLDIDTGYNAINHNFKISTNNMGQHYIGRLTIDELAELSLKEIHKIFHIDNKPELYMLNGRIITNNSPVIIYENKPYFSNPILFELLTNIENKYSNTKQIINPQKYPRMRFNKYTDGQHEYSDLIDDIIAIIGVYGDDVIGNLLISKSAYKLLLEENIQIKQFDEYLQRHFYYECSGDLYGCIEFSDIHADINIVAEKYIFLNVFDLYDKFDHTSLHKIDII